MLTGERPHAFAGSLVTLLEAIEGEAPSRPSASDPRLGRELDTIVSKALAVEREERYASVGDLAADVRRYLAGEPVRARAPSTWYLLRKLVQRNRLATAFAATIFVVSVGFTVHSAVQNARLEREVANANEMMRRMEDWLVYVPDSVLQHAALNPDYAPPELTSRSAVREALLRASKNRE
jgi:hypothetical protein